MSRQACHLIGMLAEVLGHSFCGLALHFVDDLLKMVVITIQARRDCESRMILAAARPRCGLASVHVELHHSQVQGDVHVKTSFLGAPITVFHCGPADHGGSSGCSAGSGAAALPGRGAAAAHRRATGQRPLRQATPVLCNAPAPGEGGARRIFSLLLLTPWRRSLVLQPRLCRAAGSAAGTSGTRLITRSSQPSCFAFSMCSGGAQHAADDSSTQLFKPACACKQVLEEWQPQEWRRALQPVARGVAAACGDSAAATRTLGRAMYAALVARAPDAASTALDAMTPTAQRQLFAATTAAPPAPSRSLGSRPASQHSSRPRSQPASRPDSAGSAGTNISGELVSPIDSAGPYTPAPQAAAAPATPWSRGLPQRVDSSMAYTAQCPATVGAHPRRSVGLPQRLSAGPHRTPQPPSRMESSAGAAHVGTADALAAGLHPQQRLSAPTGRHSQLGRPPRRVSQALPVREVVSDANAVAASCAQPLLEPGSGCGGAPTIRSLVITIQSAGAAPSQ